MKRERGRRKEKNSVHLSLQAYPATPGFSDTRQPSTSPSKNLPELQSKIIVNAIYYQIVYVVHNIIEASTYVQYIVHYYSDNQMSLPWST
jgi:hypothetical protein